MAMAAAAFTSGTSVANATGKTPSCRMPPSRRALTMPMSSRKRHSIPRKMSFVKGPSALPPLSPVSSADDERAAEHEHGAIREGVAQQVRPRKCDAVRFSEPAREPMPTMIAGDSMSAIAATMCPPDVMPSCPRKEVAAMKVTAETEP